MICNKIIDNSHLFEKNNSYIVDTNVLLALFGNKVFINQASNNPKLSDAIKYYNKAVSVKAEVYVPSIVISEFVNRFFRQRFKELKQKDPNQYQDYKKDYRMSQDYKTDSEYIKQVIKQDILHNIKLINDEFDKVDIDTIFNFGNADFNDNLIIHIANQNGMYLISGDNDTKTIPF